MKRGLRTVAAAAVGFVVPIGLGVLALVLSLSARDTASSTTRATIAAAKDATAPCAQASDPVHNLDCVIGTEISSRAAVRSSEQAHNDRRFELLYGVVCEVLSRFPSPALAPYLDRLHCAAELAQQLSPSTTSTSTRVVVVPSASPSPVPGSSVRPPSRPPSPARTTPPSTSMTSSAPPPLVHIGSLICIGGCP